MKESTALPVIHFYPKGDRQTASSRQRAFNIADRLVSSGFACIVHQSFGNMLNKTKWPAKGMVAIKTFRSFLHTKPNDIIYLQRSVYSNYFVIIVLLHRFLFKRKIVFDFDDAIFLHLPKQMKWLTRRADMVITGSHMLHEWATQYNSNVHLIPTAIDYNCYADYSVAYDECNMITIGWIGHAPDHYDNLKLLVPVMKECAKRKLKVKLMIVGSLNSEKVKSLFNNIADLQTVFIDSLDWSKHDVVPKTIHAFDIGVMPLADTKWNKGKCAFKAIEYMALGIPVVVSAMGENNYLVEDGYNGFSASNTEEWVKKLEQLTYNTGLRKKLGLNGQETVRNKYSYQVTIPQLQTVLQAI